MHSSLCEKLWRQTVQQCNNNASQHIYATMQCTDKCWLKMCPRKIYWRSSKSNIYNGTGMLSSLAICYEKKNTTKKTQTVKQLNLNHGRMDIKLCFRPTSTAAKAWPHSHWSLFRRCCTKFSHPLSYQQLSLTSNNRAMVWNAQELPFTTSHYILNWKITTLVSLRFFWHKSNMNLS